MVKKKKKKKSPQLSANAGEASLIPGWGRSPGRGNGNPFQYPCLGIPTDRGAWRATIHGFPKSQTRLSDCTTAATWISYSESSDSLCASYAPLALFSLISLSLFSLTLTFYPSSFPCHLLNSGFSFTFTTFLSLSLTRSPSLFHLLFHSVV